MKAKDLWLAVGASVVWVACLLGVIYDLPSQDQVGMRSLVWLIRGAEYVALFSLPPLATQFARRATAAMRKRAGGTLRGDVAGNDLVSPP